MNNLNNGMTDVQKMITNKDEDIKPHKIIGFKSKNNEIIQECKFYKSGGCLNGKECKFKHVSESPLLGQNFSLEKT